MCHLILLMPLIALAVFWIWPIAIAAPAYAVVTLLSVWMYALIWRAMHRPVRVGSEELLQSQGKVVEVEGATLRVLVHSELWNAESNEPLHPGERVKVVGKDGLVLQVRRIDSVENKAPLHVVNRSL